MNRIKAAIYRLRWVGVIFAAAGIYIGLSGSELLRSQSGVLAWKALLVTVAIALADMTRRHIFPYLDLSELLDTKSGLELNRQAGLIFLGVSIFYGAVIIAFLSGL